MITGVVSSQIRGYQTVNKMLQLFIDNKVLQTGMLSVDNTVKSVKTKKQKS